MKTQIRIGLADDHNIVLDGLSALFKPFNNIKIVFTAKDGEDLIEKVRSHDIDLILLDLEMPIMSGHQAFDILRKEMPNLKIIILSSIYEKLYIVEYYKRGVSAYLHKNCGEEKLLEVINWVQTNGRYLDNDSADMLVEAAYEKPSHDTLNVVFSEREISIIKLICRDKSSKEIADALSLSVRTVEHQRSNILSKINARSVSAIVTYAIKHKIVIV